MKTEADRGSTPRPYPTVARAPLTARQRAQFVQLQGRVYEPTQNPILRQAIGGGRAAEAAVAAAVERGMAAAQERMAGAAGQAIRAAATGAIRIENHVKVDGGRVTGTSATSTAPIVGNIGSNRPGYNGGGGGR